MIYMSWHQTLCPYQSTYYLKLTGHDLCHITSVEPTNNTGRYSPRIRELHRPQSQWLCFSSTVLPIRTQETCTIICHLSRYISDNNWKLAKGHYSFSLRYPCSDKFDRFHKWYKTFVWPKSLHNFNLVCTNIWFQLFLLGKLLTRHSNMMFLGIKTQIFNSNWPQGNLWADSTDQIYWVRSSQSSPRSSR